MQLLMCLHLWNVEPNPELECRIRRSEETCEVSIECDVGSKIIVDRQTVINLKEELKLICHPSEQWKGVEQENLGSIRCVRRDELEQTRSSRPDR